MAVVRPAVVDDADAIASVQVRAWQVAYRGHMPDEYLDAMSIPDRQAGWRAGIAEGATDRAVIVIEDPQDGHVCGFSVVGDPRNEGPNAPGEGELYAINLEPEAWGRGLGVPLIDGAIDALRARGATSAYLWVVEGNARARRFYEREGWTADGGVKADDFGGRAVREVRYGRVLSGPPARD